MKLSLIMSALLLNAGILTASVLPTSITREPLMVGSPSERLSLGFTYESIKLAIDQDMGPDATLEADAYAAYIGYDVLDWLTVFATLGSSEVDADNMIETDPAFKFSFGGSAYLWQGDVLVPEYMAGRFTVKASLEFSHYESDIQEGTVDWWDVTAALPLGYEIYDREKASPRGIDTSLAFFAGPAIQYIQGSWDYAGMNDDFSAKQLFGVVGGVEIFISPRLSFGGEINYFDETTVMGSVRFHL